MGKVTITTFMEPYDDEEARRVKMELLEDLMEGTPW